MTPARAAPGPAAAADARPQAPAGGERRARPRSPRPRRTAPGRRVRRHGPAQRRDPRARLLPELRRQPVRPADLPGESTTQLQSEENGTPLFNRAIAATYPTGSTFKPVTAMAAIEEGVITPDEHDRRRRQVRARRPRFQNAGEAVYGPLQIPGALTVSSDVFFYQLGLGMNPTGPVLQEWARRLGIGRRTGIDIPGEFAGLVPDSKWRNEGYEEYLRCVKKAKVTPARTRRCSRAAASSARGRRATTSTSPSARATCRRRRCSSPPPTRRSSTAAASCARTSASRSRTAAAACSRSCACPPGAASNSTDAAATRSWPACTAPPPPPAARRATSSPTSRTATSCTARPAPPSASRTPTSPGTPATSTIRPSRSSW